MKFLAVLLALTASLSARGWKSDLKNLIRTNSKTEQESLMGRILKSNPKWQEVTSYIKSMPFPEPAEKGKVILRKIMCIDGVERPWVLYVPSEYRPDTPTPLLVVLHGGVSRAKIIKDPVKYAQENPFTSLGEKKGWLLLYPFGQSGATWWDDVGMANIKNLIREVKRKYNVDDDRVWMGGFSDGASASFLFAMIDPTDFAAFVALNGHMGVGSLDGDLPTYATNFFNTPVYAVTTFHDPLYPSKKMRPTIEMANRAGGKIFYREHEGKHDFTYANEELPLIANFLERHIRDPFPSKIIWEAAEKRFGVSRWFAIDKVTTDEPAPWYKDYNVTLVDDRVTIGFFPDDTFKGPGVKVGKVIEKSPAEEMGMKAGDIIVKGDGIKIKNMEDIYRYKATIKRGDSLKITVLRDKKEITLNGRIPEPENYLLFKRELPSALAEVSFAANKIEIKASRLGAFRIFIHPDMIQLNQNLVILVNEKEVYNKKIKPDLEFLLRNFLKNRDRRLLYVAQVKVTL